jgi:zinc transport system substrate-binding protein
VTYLAKPGDSDETFQLSDVQITLLARSHLYLRSGLPFENSRWFRAMETAGAPPIVDLREGVELREMERHSHLEAPEDQPGSQHRNHHQENLEQAAERGRRDPHIWLSPRRLVIIANTIAGALERLAPEHGPELRANLATLSAELAALDAELKAALAPLAGNVFFVFHPAWGYFADDYGLRQVAIEIEGKEPTDHELTALVQRARTERIRVIFVEPQRKSTSAENVASALGARLETLDPLAYDVPANLRRVAARLQAAPAARQSTP